jgi:hypothetical protein
MGKEESKMACGYLKIRMSAGFVFLLYRIPKYSLFRKSESRDERKRILYYDDTRVKRS